MSRRTLLFAVAAAVIVVGIGTAVLLPDGRPHRAPVCASPDPLDCASGGGGFGGVSAPDNRLPLRIAVGTAGIVVGVGVFAYATRRGRE
jgi:hypothetical protein